MHNDVITRHGDTYLLSRLAALLPDGEREEVHAAYLGDGHQAWWDLFVERFPGSADAAAAETDPVKTTWRRMLDCDEICWDCHGGVVRVRDGQVTWYATQAEWQRAAEWAKAVAPSAGYEHAFYDDFCGECEGVVDGGSDSLPLAARYAAGKYDMTTEEGREEALEDVFGRDEDALAYACMLLDMAAEGA